MNHTLYSQQYINQENHNIMKTSFQIITPPCLTIRKSSPLAALVRSIGRILPVMAGMALILMSMASNAVAGPDGQYHFVSASGKLKIAGETAYLSEDSLSGFGAVKNGRATIRNNRLQLYPQQGAAMIDEVLSSYGASGVSVKVSGPTSIRLKKKGAGYSGTSQPLVLSISGSYDGERYSGKMKWTYKVTVKGDKLVATAPISGSIAGMKVSGIITMTCSK